MEESWLIWRPTAFKKSEFVPLHRYPWAHTIGTPGSVDINVSSLLAEPEVLGKFTGVLHLHPPEMGAVLSGTDLAWMDGWTAALDKSVTCAIFDGTDFRVYVGFNVDVAFEVSVMSVFGFNFYKWARVHVPRFREVFSEYEEFICLDRNKRWIR